MTDRKRTIRGAIVLTTILLFFLAARFLPAVETHASSLAVNAGYTNQLLPLLAILCTGALALGLVDRRQAGVPSPAKGVWRPAPHWGWQVLGAIVLCALVVVVIPIWSQEDDYFGLRLTLMDQGKRPYEDFEFAYGYLVIGLPHMLHRAGLSIQVALEITLTLMVSAGVGAFGLLTRRWISGARLRSVLFWAFVASSVFVDPGPSLNYNFGRYALPLALIVELAVRLPRMPPASALAASGAASLLIYLISAEMGCAFTAALLMWLAVMCRQLPWRTSAATALGATAAVALLLLFARSMFMTLWAYGQSQVLVPVVPNPIMLLFVFAFLVVGGRAVGEAWNAFREPGGHGATRSGFLACAALAAALAPAAIGRSWPTITLAYGFAPMLLLVHILEDERPRWAMGSAALLVGFIAYSASFGIRTDVGREVAVARIAYHGGSLALTRVRRPAPPFLKDRFPHAYDPLKVIDVRAGLADIGYYPGLGDGNVTTEAAIARKTRELRRAAVYIIPEHRKPDGRQVIARGLGSLAIAGLYPLRLEARDDARQFTAPFVDRLYDHCRELARADRVIACRYEERGGDATLNAQVTPVR